MANVLLYIASLSIKNFLKINSSIIGVTKQVKNNSKNIFELFFYSFSTIFLLGIEI